MTFIDSEKSVHGGKPIELFKFEGTYADYFYTSAPGDISFEGDDYSAIAIKRGAIAAGTQEDDGLDITIDMPVSTELVQTYAFSTPPPELDLTLFRYHRGAPGDFVPYWTGPVNNIKVTGGTATLRCPSALAHALVGDFPNVYYQTPCNHALYDPRCGIEEASFTVATTVSSVNGRQIEVASVGALDGILVAGEIALASGERRMIVAQSGTTLTVNFPFHALLATTAVELVAGCNHAYKGDCLLVFNNQLRFGGMPFMTPENVFTEGMEPAVPIDDNTCLPEVADDSDWIYEFIFINECDANSSNVLFDAPGSGGLYTPSDSLDWVEEPSFYSKRDPAGQGHRYYIRARIPKAAGQWNVTFQNPNLSTPPGGYDVTVLGRHWYEATTTQLFAHHYNGGGVIDFNFNLGAIEARP